MPLNPVCHVTVQRRGSNVLREMSEIINHFQPLTTMLIPTMVPMAHAELDGQCSQIRAAKAIVMMPSKSIQPAPPCLRA